MERRSGRRREGADRRSAVFRSIRLRMALSHGAVLASIVIVLGAVGYFLLATSEARRATEQITAAAQEQVDAVRDGAAAGVPDIDVPSTSATRVAVFRANGALVGDASDAPRWLRPHPSRVVTISFAGEPVRIVTLPARLPSGGAVTVVAGRSLAAEDELLDRVQWLLVVGGVLATAAGILAGWFLAGRALRPVRRAYEAQANFAANASHEFRTPLAFVRAGVEVLADREPALGGEVLSEVDYLTGLTERLLALARADDASLALERQPVALQALWRRSVERNERIHGVRVRVGDSAAARDLVVSADPVALEAVLDIVLENVARHGGGTADLCVEQTDGRVRLTIADHGPGMRSDQRAAAFDRFYRTDPSRSRDAGGAGLGLAIARELVIAQRGAIWLEPAPDGGVAAVVELAAEATDPIR
jgi:signal transduction histidine kinase